MLGKILLTAFNAVFPIVLLILLGYVLRQRGFLKETFIKNGNALVFRLCLPCMLFVSIYNISAVSDLPWDVVIYCGLAVMVLFGIGMCVAIITTKDHRRRGVIWQCCFRSNYVLIGIPLCATLGGETAAAVGAVVATLTIPMFNIFAVIALATFSHDENGNRAGAKKILLDIITNPLILAVAAGLVCLLLRSLQVRIFDEVVFSLSRDAEFLYKVIYNLNVIASPLALLVMGGQFQFSMTGGMLREITVATVFRVVIAPVLAIGAALLLDRYTNLLSCGPETVPAILALFGSPVAVSSAIMAAEMKNDEQLAAQLVVWTCVASMFTIFLLTSALMAMGFLAV